MASSCPPFRRRPAARLPVAPALARFASESCQRCPSRRVPPRYATAALADKPSWRQRHQWVTVPCAVVPPQAACTCSCATRSSAKHTPVPTARRRRAAPARCSRFPGSRASFLIVSGCRNHRASTSTPGLSLVAWHMRRCAPCKAQCRRAQFRILVYRRARYRAACELGVCRPLVQQL